ncbi:MAG: hypothetical protein CVU52_11235 [Deltaproteobacteria bacterium HGW-Deltaproteobacteria-10]|nr:MAG: hypothetical protein CVU52_11235 [Deltaproteobacteria bacterium HGW-Deltaproteobacteria-10]
MFFYVIQAKLRIKKLKFAAWVADPKGCFREIGGTCRSLMNRGSEKSYNVLIAIGQNFIIKFQQDQA